MIKYIKTILSGIYALMQGMYITMKNFIRPKVTEKYPENRGKKFPFDRVRGELTMPHDSDNYHKCTACMICMNNCPNGTITVTPRMDPDPETGKDKRVLDSYTYNIGSCIYCDLCVQSCPQDAIEWSINFEHAVFTREKLVYTLNREGSSLKPKEPRQATPPVTEAKPETANE